MTVSSLPKVALLGRPNVGKSTLFNRLIRSNRAITHDRPGVTRDRMEGRVTREGESFILIDTGGVTLDGSSTPAEGPDSLRGFEAAVLEQAESAVAEAALLLLVVDGREGLTPFDAHLAAFLRRKNKPLILLINKIDGPEKEALLMADFHALGLDCRAISSAHGRGVRELESEILERLFPPVEDHDDPVPEILLKGASRRQRKRLQAEYRAGRTGGASAENPDIDGAPSLEENPERDDALSDEGAVNDDEIKGCCADEEDLCPAEGSDWEIDFCADDGSDREATSPPEDAPDAPLRLALLGRPNAGKSSLVNALVGKNRMIVSDIAGTTRDSVDVAVEVGGRPVTFVDTAGVRRRTKITDQVERYSVNSSIKSSTKAQVTLLVLDGEEGLTAQDKRLIDLLHERRTPFMVLVNKCDLILPKLRKEAEQAYRKALVFCPHVPLLMVSALKGRNLDKIVSTAESIRRECGTRIGTGRLNRALESVLAAHQPPLVKGVRAKFFYLTQAETAPPTFVFFVSDAERVPATYARHLERSLRKTFGIVHAPMRVHFRSSHKKGRG